MLCRRSAGSSNPLVTSKLARRFEGCDGTARAVRFWIHFKKNKVSDRLAGVGGFVDFGVGKFQWMHRTVVYAPPPYHGAMKSLSFPNGTQFATPPWIPRNVAAYTTVYANIPNAFDNFGPLFDELYNEGKPGLWDEVLRGAQRRTQWVRGSTFARNWSLNWGRGLSS